MFTLDIDRFQFELQDGTLKHVGASTLGATAKLYEIADVEARGFGGDRVKIATSDDEGNEVELALSESAAAELAAELDALTES